HPAMPSWRLRSSGEHFTDFSLPVKWRIFRRLEKAFSKQSLYHPSPPVTFARRRQRMRTLRITSGLGKRYS
ncbi:hypothetical protein, partial [Halomonas sp.]|uniref:hypothetical protein n=1 Tax=Halomonas sp. TaxID=1486246 RepID=UPI00257F418E